MEFVRNAWYVAAWAREVGRHPLARVVLDEPVLLYRKLDGTAVAVSNICPHRFAPLSMGELVGDAIQCAYHGLQFDCSGACAHNPHGPIAGGLQIRAYPMVERHDLIWVWMGAPERADGAAIPDFSHLTDSRRKTVGGVSQVRCNYGLMVDNLMDLSHAQFLHKQGASTDAFSNVRRSVEQVGTTVYNNICYPDASAPAQFRRALKEPDIRVDFWTDIEWHPVTLMRNNVGVAPAGQPRELGINHIGTHIITPETPSTCLYFYGSSRNYLQDDERIDEGWREWQRVALNEQDKPMCEAIEAMQHQVRGLGMKGVLLACDAAAVRVARLTRELIAAEAAESAGAA